MRWGESIQNEPGQYKRGLLRKGGTCRVEKKRRHRCSLSQKTKKKKCGHAFLFNEEKSGWKEGKGRGSEKHFFLKRNEKGSGPVPWLFREEKGKAIRASERKKKKKGARG